MMSMRPSALAACDSSVDTILTLPEQTGTIAIAESCRTTALAFLNESQHWGKAELAMWLMGPYAQLTQYVAPIAQRRSGEFVQRPVPLLREIDVRMVERVIRSAHTEVVATLMKVPDAEAAASFAFSMISAGFVARCEDKQHVSGWVPTSDARRLADRVLSLLAVDYLTRPADYDTELSVCSHCTNVEFDGFSRMRGLCSRHGNSMFVPRTHNSTIPWMPERA
ncbi:MAG: hypothetical protein JWP97_966 [Labilithrix sp.]|nr:hypothetical protein [Labilithrix sp.]